MTIAKQKIIRDANLNRYTKDQQQTAIVDLLDNLPDELLQENHERLAAIYKLITPRRAKKPKSDFDWVSMAKSKEDRRYYITEAYYNANKKELVATDGDRLHLAPIDLGLAESTHLDGMKQPVDCGNFPDYTRIIPEIGESHVQSSVPHWQDLEIKPHPLKSKKQQIIFEGHKIDFDYWTAAIGDNPQRWTCWHIPGDTGTPLLFIRDDGAKAVIMQMRS